MNKRIDTDIKEQVDLPLGTAFGIVMQGFRIRFGRSLITVFGVVLGIAFLMSNLTNQIVRDAIRDEESLRSAVKRMTSFLFAETGPPEGKTMAVIQNGALDEAETRLAGALQESGVAGLNWFGSGGAQPIEVRSGVIRRVPLHDVAHEARAILLLGAETPGEDVIGYLSGLPKETVVAVSHPAESAALRNAGRSVVRLSTEPTSEELAKMAAERRAQRFRRRWILVISLLVTVMGIANAMLMSVTERFREIGTMKCLGAKSAFIRRLFLIESSMMGVLGGACGVAAGAAFSITVNCSIYGFGMLRSLNVGALVSASVVSILAGVALSILAAINPANVAASMTPSHALRANV